MADNKIISVSAGIDENSFRSLTSHIRDATREVEQLGDALSHLARGQAGAGPVSVGGAARAGTSPEGFSQAQPAMQASGMGATLTQGLAGVGPAMRSAAADARTGARALGDSLREAASAGEPQIRRLQSAVEALAAAMRQVKSMPSLAGADAGAQRYLPGMAPTPSYAASGDQVQAQLPGIRDASARRTMMGLQPQVVQVAGTGPSSIPVHLGVPLPREEMTDEELSAISPGGGMMRRLGRGLSQPIKAPQVITDMIPAGLRGAAAKYGPIAAAGYAAYKTYDWMTQAQANVNVPNAEEALQARPWYASNLKAAAGSTFGSMGVSILGGDLATARAAKLAMRDVDQQRLGGLDMTIRREQLGAHQQGLPWFTERITGEGMGSTSGATVGNLKALIGNKTDQAVTEFSNSWGDTILRGLGKVQQKVYKFNDWLDSAVLSPEHAAARKTERDERTARLLTRGDNEDTETKQEIGMRHVEANIPLQRMEEFRKRTEAYKASDPMFNYISGGLMSGAMGTMGMLRGAGIGQSLVRDKNDFNNVIGYSGDRWAAGIIARGFDPGQAIALRQAVQGSGGRGLMHHGDDLLEMQAGGLGNAASLFGVGAQLGGGYNGKGLPPLLQAVQGAIGRGGMDVTAGAGLGEQVGGLLRQGHVGLGGAEAFEAIAGAAYTPALAGENRAARDVRAAGAMGEGLQYEAQRMGGGIDPLGEALTRRAALRVAGNRGPEVASALTRVMRNPAEFEQLMRSGRVPRGLAAMGIEAKDFKQLKEEQDLQNVVRLVQRTLPKGEAGDFARRMIANKGDVSSSVTGLLDDRLGKGYSERLAALRKKSPGSAKLAKMEREAMGAYRPALEGFAEIAATADGDRSSPEAITSALELQLGRGFGRPVRGGGAHDVIGKDALERTAVETQAELERQKSGKKFEQEGKFKDSAKGASVEAQAMASANQGMQAMGDQATHLAATSQALDTALARVALGMNRLADKMGVPRRAN